MYIQYIAQYISMYSMFKWTLSTLHNTSIHMQTGIQYIAHCQRYMQISRWEYGTSHTVSTTKHLHIFKRSLVQMFGTDRALRAPNVLDIDVRWGQDVTLTSADTCVVVGGMYGKIFTPLQFEACVTY